MTVMNDIMEVAKKTWDRSPMFQKLYNINDIKDFESIPFITKSTLLEDQKKNPPFGSNLVVEKKDLCRVHRTSGTTQRPLLLTLTKKDMEIVHTVGSKAFRIAGLAEDDIVFNCMNYSMWMGGFTDHLSLEKAGGCVVPYGVGNTENLISLLLEIDNPSLHCTPSYLNIIKKVLHEKFNKSPRELGLKKGFFGGEGGLQDKSFRDRIEEEWGLEAINANYGMSDVISILGSECKVKDNLHFVANEYLYIELINSELKKVPFEVGAEGELVVTTLQKESQPLIRYRTSDVIKIISTDPCSCGEESFRFKVVGRADDMITIKGINFYPDSLRDIISNYKSFSINYQIEVENKSPLETFTLILEKVSEDYKSEIDSLLNEINKKFYVKPNVKVLDKIQIEGNKIKSLKKV